MDFDTAFDLLISNEGKLSMDRKDRGNWTSGAVGVGELKGSMYGISAMSYPTLDIKNLTLSDAKVIYKRDFWDQMKLSLLPPEICFDMFDTAVNSGVGRAIKLLQKTVGTAEDGIIGSKTISLSHSTEDLSKKFNGNRLLFMTNLSTWADQGKGWARRIAHNLLLENL
ncbi:lysozyme [Caudoviricetes sp.]|nr:lysozyme [Caudoviricetes sp.]